MERELKFRAWDKAKNEWIIIGFNMIGETTMFNVLQTYAIPDFNNIVVSQFTGLLDKNGKEIYEGDIVSKLRNSEPGNWASPMVHTPEHFYTVKFEDGCFRNDNGTTLDIFIRGPRGVVEWEIIGNIYENPELLK